jgi:Ca2+-binding RTX toxin-like protein
MNRSHVRSLALIALVAAPMAVLSGPLAPVAAGTGLTCQGMSATIVGTPGDDVIAGTAGPDVIVSLEGDDTVTAGAGDDVVCGGRGADRLNGEDGNDRLHGERNGLRPGQEQVHAGLGDVLAGGPGDDVIDPGWDKHSDVGGYLLDTFSYRDSQVGVTLDLERGVGYGEGTDTLVVEGRVVVLGSDFDDVILGSPRTDWIVAFAGDDFVDGRGGWDNLVDQQDIGSPDATRDDDFFTGGAGNDYIEPGRGMDTARGGPGNDRIEDLFGPSVVGGGTGDDELTVAVVIDQDVQSRILGNSGEDELNVSVSRGGTSARSSSGFVNLRQGRIRAIIDGSEESPIGKGSVGGVEILSVPEGSWRVRGTGRDETVYGPFLDTSRVVARMGGGDDRVFGGPGDDLINGGPGRDAAHPGGGYDMCKSVERVSAQDRCEN